MRWIITFMMALTMTASRVEETLFSWASDDGSLALLRGQQIVWKFNFGSELSKPYFHPLNLPGGQTLTWESPPDHP